MALLKILNGSLNVLIIRIAKTYLFISMIIKILEKMTINAVDVYAKYPRELKRLSNLDINKYNELTKNRPKLIFYSIFS